MLHLKNQSYTDSVTDQYGHKFQEVLFAAYARKLYKSDENFIPPIRLFLRLAEQVRKKRPVQSLAVFCVVILPGIK